MIADGSQERRRLMRLGQEAGLQGMPPPTNEPVWIGAGLVMLESLKRSDKPVGASDCARFALSLLDASLSRTRKGPIECARGCNFCCSSPVSVTAPEALLLSAWIKRNAVGREDDRQPRAIAAMAQPRTGRSIEELIAARQPCVLLRDGACMAYDARPGNCRRLFSTSRAACEADFKGAAVVIPTVAEAMQKATHIRALQLGAIAAVGRPVVAYELSQALAIALATPDAEALWLTGEDVFAEAAIKQPPLELHAMIERWRGHLLRFH